MLHPRVKRALELSGLHERLKVSVVRDFYWAVVDRRWLRARRDEINFYRKLLQEFQPGDLIFDIGANVGDKTDVFLRLGARVVVVEPDETCQKIISEKFLKLRFSPKPVVIIGKAVSDEVTTKTMWVDGPKSALNTLSDKWVTALKGEQKRFDTAVSSQEFGVQKKVETVTLGQLIATHGMPFFVKIDVEGYEHIALKGLTRPVPYLSFEVNLPEFRPEAADCVHLLEKIEPRGQFNYAADCHAGLSLHDWLKAPELLEILATIQEKSIEVFWRTAAGVGRKVA